MPGSRYLTCRCAPNTFTTNVRPLLNALSEESIGSLRDARIYPLFRMPSIPQNIPLLYVLLRLYNRDKNAFQLGQYPVKLTVNDVALILDLPNSGLHFTFSRSPLQDITHKSLTEEIRRITAEEWSPTLEGRRLNLLVNYLLALFLFPLKSLKVPACIKKITCLSDFVKYNWPLAIHEFLHIQFDHLSRVSAIRSAGSNIGSLEGCATVLLVWMYEHTKVQAALVDLARPRICRWSPSISYSAKFCLKVQDNLHKKNYVIKKLNNLLDGEKALLGEEDDDSDFESVPPRKEKRRRIDEKLGYENKIIEKRFLRIKEKNLMKKIRVEMKKVRSEEKADEAVQSDEGWKGLENRLKEFIKVEVDGLKTLCETWFKTLAAECKPSTSSPPPTLSPRMTSVPTTQFSQLTSTSECTLVPKTQLQSPQVVRGSPRRVKKVVCKRTLNIPDKATNYPGRLFIPERVRESIDFVLTKIVDRSMLIIESENISMSRGEIDDLLGQGWVMDNHLNAYSVVLGAKRNRMPERVRSYLYVSPNHEYYKRSNARNYTRLISHITTEAVNTSDIILMPCHLGSHWALLVCLLKERRWEYYDSLPSSLHRAGVHANLKALQEDVSQAFPEDFVNWPVVDAVGLPKQNNSFDCGVFVLKFMEAVSSTAVISWEDHKNWQDDMPRFRAELVAEIFKTFSSNISEKISGLE